MVLRGTFKNYHLTVPLDFCKKTLLFPSQEYAGPANVKKPQFSRGFGKKFQYFDSRGAGVFGGFNCSMLMQQKHPYQDKALDTHLAKIRDVKWRPVGG